MEYVSPSAWHGAGHEPADLVGDNAFEYIHPEDRQKSVATFSELVEASENYTTGRVEFRFRHADGSWVWLEGRGSNQTASTIGGYIISLRDITDRKEYERELQQERDRFERFASFVSHDLRNPVNVAKGQLQLATEDCESDHLDAVARSLDRIDELIDDVLTFSREGTTEPQVDAITIAQTVEESWRTIETEAATLDVTTDRSILADESKLQQLLENLLRNAIEHGGDDVTITVGALDAGFYVEDDGCGIQDEARESLLEYGFSTKASGTGLGLNIVHEVAKNHNWELTITEGDGGGTRFEFTGVEFVD